ncbi:hypothetical protein AVEN_218136-1 [Araneus ventricosus]|uniref:Uncharacterized protein n=1 Tax=Araneus ventricosus TaxID=182803 RepID=A0A4Y2HQF6_ARAVE|nr:hypothetical protein AVEN_265957-1 [Araneus ventricosus]GBM67492.1 hypothetical protein AVEN_218136-1 [Araneus ventricosus]
MKDEVYFPPLPRNLEDLRTRIGNALNLVTADMLKRVPEEMDYRLDVVLVTRGSHIEHRAGLSKSGARCKVDLRGLETNFVQQNNSLPFYIYYIAINWFKLSIWFRT